MSDPMPPRCSHDRIPSRRFRRDRLAAGHEGRGRPVARVVRARGPAPRGPRRRGAREEPRPPGRPGSGGRGPRASGPGPLPGRSHGIGRAELNRLLARTADAPLETTGHLALRPDVRSAEERLVEAEGASPELRAGAVVIDRDRLAASLARKDFRPDFTVQAGYMSRGSLDPMWQAGGGITLPIHRKRLASGLAEAEARSRESTRRLESMRLQLRFRTEERLRPLRA